MAHAPTVEQQAILDAYLTGNDVTVVAGAGTGKTTTLSMLAEATPKKKCLYMAFNKAVQVEAVDRFPTNTVCKTAHSLAYQAIMRDKPEYRTRLQAGRVPFSVTKRVLAFEFDSGVTIGGKHITLAALQRCALDTVSNFCRTTRDKPSERDVPNIKGIDPAEAQYGEGYRLLQSVVIGPARRAWEDICDPKGVLRFSHDHYLKMWADTHPVLPFDVIFFDEAQDADPLLQDVVARQNHAQRVVVGDPNQAIYQWRGAIDALDSFSGARLPLSESFRFGPEIAEQANVFLDMLGAEMRITGLGAPGVVGPIEGGTDAVLCRTNAGTIQVVLDALLEDQAVCLVGGSANLKGFFMAATDLLVGKRTSYPELAAFLSWNDLVEYTANDPHGQDLAVLVRMVNEHGPTVLLDALAKCVDESRADVIVSTAHKAKGREWKRVQIYTDFERPVDKKTGEVKPPSEDYLRLAYVAVTRAKRYLDMGPLASLTEEVSA